MENLQRINYLYSEINNLYHEAALKFHLSDSAMMVLYSICNSGDSCPLSDIYKLSGTSKQTINSALRKLEAEGIVYLKKHNGKAKTVYLTEEGKARTKNTVARLLELENQILHSWSRQEQEQYMALIERYLISFREKVDALPETNGG